jgi:hypothetical protein
MDFDFSHGVMLLSFCARLQTPVGWQNRRR